MRRGAVVLDQVRAAATVSALDLEDGVGAYETRLWSVAGPGPCGRRRDACCPPLASAGGSISVSPLQASSAASEQSPPGEDPGVEVDLVKDVAVVVDRAQFEPCVAVESAGPAEQAVAVVAEVVGPGERPAGAGDRSEALDEAGVEELGEALATDARRAVGPVQLEELGGGEELVAPDVGEDLRRRAAGSRTAPSDRVGRVGRRRRRSG